jgi:hypothetical protein
MPVKAMDLFDAYAKNALPKDHGYIVTSFFSSNSVYSRYEIVSYANVKSIYPSEDGLTFQTDGKKLYILVEPANYPNKGMEPYVRSTAEKIPLRFSELDSHVCKNQTRIYWSKDSVMSYGAFTVARPEGINFSFCFYQLPDVIQSLQLFFEKTFNKEASVPLADSKKVAAAFAENIKTKMVMDFQ